MFVWNDVITWGLLLINESGVVKFRYLVTHRKFCTYTWSKQVLAPGTLVFCYWFQFPWFL